MPRGGVALSTSSAWPESTASAFELAARLGYDGVEVMVSGDPVSQDVDALARLSDYHGMPVVSVHAPCLLVTQRVWGTDPWEKLHRSAATARRLGADVVVVHPPFRWQADYARDFAVGIRKITDDSGVAIAVENMFPVRLRRREFVPYAPGWSPLDGDFDHVALDLSHTAVSGSDPRRMARELGGRLHHVHLADGLGTAKDEHLVPGRGTQPCADFLGQLARSGFDGAVVIEVNTRRAAGRGEREADLAEALGFAREHLTDRARSARLPQ